MSGLKRLSPFASWLKPRFGAPPVEITLPFWPTRCVAGSLDRADRRGHVRKRLHLGEDGLREADGRRCRCCRSWPNAVLPVITASVFSYETLKIVSKPALIVSVRM